MEGWKTRVGGILLIVAGALGVGATLFGFPGLSIEAGLAMVGAGFAALGLGHKFDRIKAVLQETGTVKKAAILALLGLPLLAGCSHTAEIVRALSTDDATVCNQISTPWGNDTFLRTKVTNGKVSCNSLSVESQGTTSVPVTVTPVLVAPATAK